jgi:predicted acylesterase/phospholipase RssA
MGRMRSALPWGTVVLFGTLFLIAWWIEDCLIYSIDWRQLVLVHLAGAISNAVGLTFLWGLAGHALSFVVYLLIAPISFIVREIAYGFDAIPADWRETLPLRMAARAGNSLVATYGGDALGNLGLGVEWALALLVRVLVALNGAAWLYNLMRRSLRYVEIAFAAPARLYRQRPELDGIAEDGVASFVAPAPQPLVRNSGKTTKLHRRQEYQRFFDSHVRSIGIVLGGGGAKGAYQAGALKAIYEFLRGYNALDKVKMITGTSIGAWNAMFWLSGLMGSKNGDAPVIESWWKSVSFGALLDFPWLYVPFWSNSILRVTPWRETFMELFGKHAARFFSAESPIHFYLTRADLGDRATSYVTNRRDISQRLDELGLDKNDNYRFFELIDGERSPDRLADAVFSSMSLPPLCATADIDGRAFEEGTLSESLPLRFAATIENCDLIFVLPLDAADTSGSRRPMLRRMLRLMDSRKDALGHSALRSADMINRFAERMERIEFGVNTVAPSIRGQGIAAEALAGLREEVAEFQQEYRRLYIFTISPAGKLELGDFELWRRREAENAFDLMYVQTRRELLARFFEDIEPEDAHVVMVDGLAPTTDDLPQPQYRRPSNW